ncbi:MAG TPA: hypothetical protein PLD63_14205 [Ignavibacteria bacterium]|nr:hypothetical protein [Ignavibacteria bacterium]
MYSIIIPKSFVNAVSFCAAFSRDSVSSVRSISGDAVLSEGSSGV